MNVFSHLCHCDDPDLQPPSAYSARLVTARKRHACDECGRIIEAGERYRRRAVRCRPPLGGDQAEESANRAGTGVLRRW